MDYKNLHTIALEKMYGPIKGQIIRQDERLRMIHLLDRIGISRTLAIVRFGNIKTKVLKTVHHKIINGSLIGQTLFESEIPFNKEYTGNHSIQLPEWLMKDFKTRDSEGLAMFSRIHLHPNAMEHEQSIYAEIIEIVPPYLANEFIGKAKRLFEINPDMLLLLEAAELMVNPANSKI